MRKLRILKTKFHIWRYIHFNRAFQVIMDLRIVPEDIADVWRKGLSKHGWRKNANSSEIIEIWQSPDARDGYQGQTEIMDYFDNNVEEVVSIDRRED